MIQINDDYYEDLTPDTVVKLLEDLKATGASATSSKKAPVAGPLSSRESCENSAGLTNLTAEPWGTDKTRSDL